MTAVRGVILALIAACAACTTTFHPAHAAASVWRLDCGQFDIANLEGRGPVLMPVSCYLIENGGEFIMFDAGLSTALAKEPERQESQTISLNRTLAEQFRELGIDPAKVGKLVVSHYHGDHHGQAGLFPNATLYIGEGDQAAYRQARTLGEIGAWFDGSRTLVPVTQDIALTADGNLTVLATPGHTPGHLSLLVRTDDRPLILTGDMVHQREQLASGESSGNHVDKERGAREIQRIKAIAEREGATIIVGHDAADIGLLPQFPASTADVN